MVTLRGGLMNVVVKPYLCGKAFCMANFSGQFPGYYRLVFQRFKAGRLARWSYRMLIFLFFVALFGDFLANDKPLFCKLEGKVYFPVINQYLVELGWGQWDARFITKNWSEHAYEMVVFPPIPYNAQQMDVRNRGFVGPLDQQRISSWRWRHWLGTDQLGRDTAAGMVAGTRTALLIGVLAMSIATLIGVLLGAAAGFFGDRGLVFPRGRVVAITLFVFIGCIYVFVGRQGAWYRAVWADQTGNEILIRMVVFLLFVFAGWLIGKGLEKVPFFKKTSALPMDLLILRLIEVVRSVPALLLLLAVLAIMEKPSVLNVMVIIGLIRWTTVALFLRSELLKIRELEYIKAAKVLGLGPWQILLRHALPNALSPVLITIAFGISSAILLEAFISFLGIGVAAEQVTWGSMLNEARRNFSAWWLAVFPGMAIFVTVSIFNFIGEGLTKATDFRHEPT